MKEKTSLDLLGLAPYSESVNTAVKKSFKGVEGFLKSVCMPALGELGFMLKDQVRYWRLNNILKIIEKAQSKIEFNGEQLQIKAHPRVALGIIEHGSLIDDDEVQELWAGIFASACSETGQQDDNLIFVDLLRQLTFAEAKILKFICEKSQKSIHPNGLVSSNIFYCDFKEISRIAGITGIHNLDRQLDHLRSLELIHGGLARNSENLTFETTPTDLALNLYVRSQGHAKSTAEYWKDYFTVTENSEIETTTNEIDKSSEPTQTIN